MTKNRNSLAKMLLSGGLAFLVAALAVGILVVTGAYNDNPLGDPQQAFERHLMALDDQDWELANTYVTEWCQSDLEGAAAAGRDLKDSGFLFYRAFAVAEVWISEDGLEALLGLDVPRNSSLPRVATMERVDGEWLVSCS